MTLSGGKQRESPGGPGFHCESAFWTLAQGGQTQIDPGNIAALKRQSSDTGEAKVSGSCGAQWHREWNSARRK